MASKQILREVYLEKRLFLSAGEWKYRNESVIEQVIDLIDENSFRYIHSFLPIADKKEVDTYQIIERYKNDNTIQFVIPKTEKEGKLSHYLLNNDCKIERNKWGIPEPVSGNLANISAIDLVIVPLIIADKLGNRIGYGKGYYDRFLETIPQAKTVGVSLLPLLDEILCIEETDALLHSIIHPT